MSLHHPTFLERCRHRLQRVGMAVLLLSMVVIALQATQGYIPVSGQAHFVEVCTSEGVQALAVDTDKHGDVVFVHHNDIASACVSVALGAPPIVPVTLHQISISERARTAEEPRRAASYLSWSPARPQPPPSLV